MWCSRGRLWMTAASSHWRTEAMKTTAVKQRNVRQFCAEKKTVDADGDEKIVRPPSTAFRQKRKPGEGKGPVSWKNLLATGIIMGMTYAGYLYALSKREAALEKERKREIGKTMIGGAFELVDHTGKKTTNEDLRGKWILLYFGFTHCPDICPDEMEKMAEITDKVTETKKRLNAPEEILPVFITVDPERDGVKEVAEYVKEFHPRMLGLTGTHEQILQACKAYRVYFSAGPADQDNDYIVDHTIIIYLIDPEGEFLDYYGQTKSAGMVSDQMIIHMKKYADSKKRPFFALS